MPKPQKKKKSAGLTSTTQAIILAHAKLVLAGLGKGHREKVYHRAMITSLNRKKVAHRSEVISPIYFMGEVVGFGRCDIIVGNLVVEFKANTKCPKSTSRQLQKYMESLASTERRRFQGMVVNFNQKTGKIDVYEEKKSV
jgi:GxxExxY protein